VRPPCACSCTRVASAVQSKSSFFHHVNRVQSSPALWRLAQELHPLHVHTPTPFHLQCVRSVQFFFFFTSPTRLRPVRTRSSARSLTRDQLAACFAWPLTTFVAVGAARGAMWGTCCVVWGPNCQRNRACRGLKRSPTLSACLCVCGQLIALCVGVCARLGYGHRRSNMLLCGRGAAP
jgi:hypothetical protein